jgi:hypothetical protein
MPFGPYADFAACVAANRDKRDPEAYCATIKREIEDKPHPMFRRRKKEKQ